MVHGIIDIICNNKYDTLRSYNIVHDISNKRMAAIVLYILSTIALYSLLPSKYKVGMHAKILKNRDI